MVGHVSCEPQQSLGDVAARIDMQESQQAQGLNLVVFVPQRKQKESRSKGQQALAGLADGNAPQPQMLDEKALSLIHESFLLAKVLSLCGERIRALFFSASRG